MTEGPPFSSSTTRRKTFSSSRRSQKQGLQVITASSGAEALRNSSRSTGPDLVLLDVVMPRDERLRGLPQDPRESRHRVLPVVMVTALDPAEERIKGLEAGRRRLPDEADQPAGAAGSRAVPAQDQASLRHRADLARSARRDRTARSRRA